MCSLNDINNYGVWKEMPNELYIIGDIHGDFFALKQSLELTGCVEFDIYNEELKYDQKNEYYNLNDGCEYYSTIKGNVRWNSVKRNCFIVFSGDIIDRCRPHNINNKKCINTISDENCDLLLLQLLYELDDQAKNYNSRVIVILGNHEIMNIQNDLNYVSLKGRENQRVDKLKNYLRSQLSNIFGIIRINKYIMVHGGINDIFFTNFNKIGMNDLFESIEVFNCKLRDFLLTDNTEFFGNNFYQSPFWDRTLGGRDYLNSNQCEEIFKNNILKIKDFNEIENEMKIIVAHCPQFVVNQTINLVNCQEYEKRIWRIDVGMSRAFDFYDMGKIKKKLTRNESILNMTYKEFFISDIQTDNRAVSCIKLTKYSEEILKGKLTIDYFYSQKMFENDIKKLMHIVSDLIKIFIDNIEKNYEPTIQNDYIYYVIKLKKLLKEITINYLNNNLSMVILSK